MSGNASRQYLVFTALAYFAFVIYGSLVPLAFRPVSFAEALDRFRAIPYLSLGISSRADWVANILLFVPLAFLWRGMLDSRIDRVLQLLTDGAVGAGCLLLSAGIEFMQIFFPPRTVSLNDIVAEGGGTLVGIAAWRLCGLRLLTWVDGWRLRRSSAGFAERFFLIYFVILFGYSLLPLDLTISPVEIYHKWREGRVHLLPGVRSGEGPFGTVYEFATDILVWIPVSWLLDRSGRSRWHAWTFTVTSAAFLEFLQLFVYSRVTDVNDVMTAMAGAWAGILLAGRKGAGGATGHVGREGVGAILLWGGAAVGWCGVLAAVFWYPYDFVTERRFIVERVAMFRLVPFQALYYGSEFHAVTEVLRKALFFAPLGGFAACMARAFGRRLPRLVGEIGALFLVGGAATVVEVGQLALPRRYPDSTDVMICAAAGWLGYWLVCFVRRRVADDALVGAALSNSREKR